MKSKLLSIVLSVLMLFTATLPVHVVYAEEDPIADEQQIAEVENNIEPEEETQEVLIVESDEEIKSEETV